MKQYFIQWISVEGEIKEGDWFLVTNQNCAQANQILCCNGFDFEGFPKRAVLEDRGFHLSNIKKVKLFLCSRKIQIGDKFISEYDNKEHICNSIQERNFYWKNKKSLTGFSCSDGFKVIGEISPEALSYCKEGMEYNEEDVKLYKHLILKDGSRLNCYTEEEDLSPRCQYANVYQIKGPCGHFH